MTLNGGVMQRTPEKPDANTDAKFSDVPIKSGGYGIIDVAWKVHYLTPTISYNAYCFTFIVSKGAMVV